MGPLLVLILLFVVMYAAMIRPQQKRAREHQTLMAAVQVGDEVMTTAGIFGTVTDVEGDVVSIEISPGTVMRVARAAIGRRMNAELDEYVPDDDFDDDDVADSVADTVPDDAPPIVSDTNGDAPTSPLAPDPAPPAPPTVTPPAVDTPPTPPVTPPPASPGSGSGPGEPG